MINMTSHYVLLKALTYINVKLKRFIILLIHSFTNDLQVLYRFIKTTKIVVLNMNFRTML